MSGIRLRRATPDDVRLYYEWAIDGDVRRQSFSDGEIAYEDHVNWFERRIADPNSHLFVLLDNGAPVGQIRFTVQGQTAEIGYSIAREARGRGLARTLVQLGVAAMAGSDVTTFVARVKPDNEPSIKAFIGCGFEQGEASDHRIFYLHNSGKNRPPNPQASLGSNAP
jgi:RimJ/RimL family protein N-acetyltransferase